MEEVIQLCVCILHCDLSSSETCINCFVCVQVKLYEDFAKSQAKHEVDEVIEGEGGGERVENKQTPPPTHVFQVG